MDEKTSYLNQKYWRNLKNKSQLAGITLDEAITPSDFEIYGNRLADRIMAIFKEGNASPMERSSILDVGCGLGRILKPFSYKFERVVGVDINQAILDAAVVYLDGVKNYELVKNDGKTLPFEEASFDYVYSGGVLQHIPEIEVIMGYFNEGLRVLKPGGLLNYTIMVWMTSREGGVSGDRVGAQITSEDIEAVINATGHELVRIYSDSADPRPHYNVLIKKVTEEVTAKNKKRKLFKLKRKNVESRPFRTGVFEDLESYVELREVWKEEPRPITFFPPTLFEKLASRYEEFTQKGREDD